jgi:hypothetical protein
MTAVGNYFYQPGDQVLESGLYFAHHAGAHCDWPKAILEASNAFPACPTCGDNIRYLLGRTAQTAGEVGEPHSRRESFDTERVYPALRLPTGKQYLHLTAYRCDQCNGPVVAGSLGTRETLISQETQIRLLGGICLECGTRQGRPPDATTTRGFLPVEWA